MRLFLSTLLFSAALTGCDSSATPTPDVVRTCTPPVGSYLSEFDGNGDLVWNSVFATEDDGSTTLGICDGPVYRQVTVYGLQEGLASEHQNGFATDGSRRLVKEDRLITTSRQPVTLTGLDLTGQCVKYCKATPALPAPPSPEADTSTP